MGSKFNMASVGLGNGMLNKYSQELKEGFEIVNIPIDQIEENELNNYSIENIDELVESIRTVGLKQNLDVMKEPDGTYKLLTGHRRLMALKILSQEDDKYKIVPCTVTALDNVKMPISDASKEKYLIHITNSTQRDMTESDKFNQYQDLIDIYTEAKNNGFVLSEKMRNLIANDMKVSPAQVGKMDYIRNNGTEELKKNILDNKISIAAASDLAHEEKELQAIIKPKKEKLIDTLDKDSYKLNSDIINDVTKSYALFTSNYTKKAKESSEVDRATYAKILTCRKKIMDEIEKLQKLIN